MTAAAATTAPPAIDTTCPCCGDDWAANPTSHWMLDVQRTELDAWATCTPCCEIMADEIATYGYAVATGRKIENVVAELTGHDVLEITEDMDASMVCRLQLVDPTQVRDSTDKYGNQLARSPKGWQGSVFASVAKYHRHHEAPQGWKYGVAVYNGNVRVGVATVGRPVSRHLDNGEALEVTRVCTMGTAPLRYNATSKLYAAAAKRAKSMGYQRLITYTLHGIESGGSLVAAGWHPTLISDGGSWRCETRPDASESAPTTAKVRWEKGLNKRAKRAVAANRIELPPVVQADATVELVAAAAAMTTDELQVARAAEAAWAPHAATAAERTETATALAVWELELETRAQVDTDELQALQAHVVGLDELVAALASWEAEEPTSAALVAA